MDVPVFTHETFETVMFSAPPLISEPTHTHDARVDKDESRTVTFTTGFP